MDYFPAFMKIEGLPCRVIGGGEVAERKVRQLCAAGAVVGVVAPQIVPALQRMVDAGEVSWQTREFIDTDIDNNALVVAATNDSALNKRVSELARARYIPVNVVDQPALCSFIVPSTIDRSPVQIAISTGGAAPVMARLLRSKIESFIPGAYGKLGKLVEGFRDQVKQRFPTTDERKAFWEKVLSGQVAESVFAGRMQHAGEQLQHMIDSEAGKPQNTGEVYLVGAGPGDPDLLTFRALRLMSQADVVLHDRLVSDEIMEMVRRDAERVYVGKERDNHSVPQDQINQMLVDLAKQGKRVLRLKGGDPFIFGRGGEEIELLAENDVPFQVVPGITSASGCASYAGIPLTHRDHSQYCIFVTGHLKDGTMDLNWNMLAQPNKTVVFYMGLKGVNVLCRELTAHGMSSQTPVALVEKGTTRDQRVLIGDLTSLPDIVRTNAVKAPTMIIVGNVVSLHDKLKWFEPNADVTANGDIG